MRHLARTLAGEEDTLILIGKLHKNNDQKRTLLYLEATQNLPTEKKTDKNTIKRWPLSRGENRMDEIRGRAKEKSQTSNASMYRATRGPSAHLFGQLEAWKASHQATNLPCQPS